MFIVSRMRIVPSWIIIIKSWNNQKDSSIVILKSLYYAVYNKYWHQFVELY